MFGQPRDARLTFVEPDGSDTSFRLSALSGKIGARAVLLRQRLAAGSSIGLIGKTGPDLVVNWLACLQAGLRPLVIQYPTVKQSHAYWIDSVRNTIGITGLAAVIADERACALGVQDLIGTIRPSDFEGLPETAEALPPVGDFEILQLSSGTTGHRKPVLFRGLDLRRHVEDYNLRLGLTFDDAIVSWLPLYHDMGYIACFVMPLMLGIDIVMMDPMSWTRQPELLFDAIERHGATTCYMPNFGFEVMARQKPRVLPSMRRWISCSEPVSAKTSNRFLETIGAGQETFIPCYAMAENIFAVSTATGVRTARLHGSDFISCGRPIEGVEIKIVDDQIWVRSPTSIERYYRAENAVCDAEGYYPTGDLGEIVDGELFVTGRKQDLLIQAGRKFMLSDIDLVLNELYPEVRGRGVTLAVKDEMLGTESPVVLIETIDFFRRRDQAAIADRLKTATGLDQIHVHFVPPRFLTKTSSGKFNRKKSAKDWTAVQSAAGGAESGTEDLATVIAGTFPTADRTRPVSESMDSLSLTILRMLLSDHGIAWDPMRTLDDIVSSAAPSPGSAAKADGDSIRIVCIGDAPMFRRVNEWHLRKLEAQIGAKVTFEHYATPPSSVLLSDLIFHDYFQPRLEDQVAFGPLNRVLDALKGASIVVTDDNAEMYYPVAQVYGALSHNLERDPRTDLISVRWQRYCQEHANLPTTLVCGADLPLDRCEESLHWFGEYLGAPIFRVANFPGLSEFTQGWEYRPLSSGELRPLDPDAFIRAFGDWIGRLDQPLRKVPGGNRERLNLTDANHYCSLSVRQQAVDRLIDSYNSFCVAGPASSLPYVRRRLQEKNKEFAQVLSFTPDILGKLPKAYECLLICGAWGGYEGEMAAIALQHIGRNVLKSSMDDAFRQSIYPVNERPDSSSDWFYPFGLSREHFQRYFRMSRDMTPVTPEAPEAPVLQVA